MILLLIAIIIIELFIQMMDGIWDLFGYKIVVIQSLLEI